MWRRRFLLATTAIASLAGCVGDDDSADSTDEDAGDSTDSDSGDTTDGDDPDADDADDDEEPELARGLREDGIDLDQLRSALDELVTSGDFRSIAGLDYFEEGEVVSTFARSVEGITEAERGRELEAATIFDKVDGGILPSEATIDVMFEYNQRYRYFEDGMLYTNPDDPGSREVRYEDYLQVVASYADEIFSMAEAFEYGSPEWDADLDVFRVPITGIQEETVNYEVEQAEVRVTRDGLPVAAGGRLVPAEGAEDDALMEERLIVLRSDGIEIERPSWVEEAASGG